MLTIPRSIAIGAVVIAVAVVITGRWQVTKAGYEGVTPIVYRLDRLTGQIRACTIDPETMKNSNSIIGASFICEAR